MNDDLKPAYGIRNGLIIAAFLWLSIFCFAKALSIYLSQ